MVRLTSLLAPDYAQCCIAVCAVTGLNAVNWLTWSLGPLFDQDQEQPLSSERPMTGGGMLAVRVCWWQLPPSLSWQPWQG
jgi:hypothetical protein